VNEGCHLPFIQCEKMCAANGRLLFYNCINVIHLPEEEQKKDPQIKPN
jgi:hypothetical protein